MPKKPSLTQLRPSTSFRSIYVGQTAKQSLGKDVTHDRACDQCYAHMDEALYIPECMTFDMTNIHAEKQMSYRTSQGPDTPLQTLTPDPSETETLIASIAAVRKWLGIADIESNPPTETLPANSVRVVSEAVILDASWEGIISPSKSDSVQHGWLDVIADTSYTSHMALGALTEPSKTEQEPDVWLEFMTRLDTDTCNNSDALATLEGFDEFCFALNPDCIR